MSPKANPPRPGRVDRDGAWRPHIDAEPEFNSFVNDHRGPDAEPPSTQIRDAEDTAPLQGSHDLSDDDSVVVDGYVDDTAEIDDTAETDLGIEADEGPEASGVAPDRRRRDPT